MITFIVMNLPKDITNIKLICTQPMVAHWGNILIPGQEYIGSIYLRDTEIITDHDNYWKYINLTAGSIGWIRKGYTEDTLHEVIPGYMKSSEINRLYTKKVEMPFIRVKCSDNRHNTFCLLSDAELFELGADKDKGRYKGKPCFTYSVYRVDDYFDYASIRRDNILNKILDGGN
jgi:hypothetical protein